MLGGLIASFILCPLQERRHTTEVRFDQLPSHTLSELERDSLKSLSQEDLSPRGPHYQHPVADFPLLGGGGGGGGAGNDCSLMFCCNLFVILSEGGLLLPFFCWFFHLTPPPSSSSFSPWFCFFLYPSFLFLLLPFPTLSL